MDPAGLAAENERLQAELRARLHEATAAAGRLRDVLENVDLLAVTLDLDGRIVYCNQRLCEVSGWGREELVGRTWLEAFPTGDREYVTNLRRGDILMHDEMPLLTRSGEFRDIWWSNTIERDADGRVTGSTSLGEDVTERNRSARMEEGLRRIATMVAAEVPPEEIFHTVTREVAGLLGGHSANLVRFGAEPFTGVVVAAWSDAGVSSMRVGEQLVFDGPTAVTRAVRTGRAARVDDYAQVEGALADRIRRLGVRQSVAAPIDVDGRPWGAITVATSGSATLAPDAEARIGEFTELVALGISSAEARAQLAASRARIVAAGDAERRRLERNLHDGAQQRLVSLSLTLRMARAGVDPASETARLLASAADELDAALEELRELARGIHPAVLTDRGLEPAIEALTERSTTPVRASLALGGPLDPPVEAAIYYVVAEAVTNVMKYAGASAVDVAIASDAGGARVEVADDGVGGADPAAGSGLRGLIDRVEALGGRLSVTSPAGGGTRIVAEFPVTPSAPSGARGPAAWAAGATRR
jgi:PAS domain S-box-containing protein